MTNCPDDNHLNHKDCPTKRQWGLEAARSANKAQAKLVKEWQLCVAYHHCPDCLAYYVEGYNHVCPPWLKELVRK